MKDLLVVIDGPAGSGKTTISKMLAERLGYAYVDTGALYRAVALAAQNAGVASDDDAELKKLCQNLSLEVRAASCGFCLMLNGEDVAHRIRTAEMSMMASAVSARPVIRQYLLDVQRNIGKQKRCVFEGRDMGTVVFPDADIKFFLDASLQTRAARRYEQYKSENRQTREDVEKDMARRDHNDSTREIAPLKPACDAVCINTTSMTPEQIVERMLSVIDTTKAENTMMNDTVIDFITGEQIPLIGAEENRQATERFLVGQKGFAKEDIEVNCPIEIVVSGETYRSKIDLVVSVNSRRMMAVKTAAGSLGSREREILAAARLVGEYQIPFCVVSDGRTATVLDTLSGRQIGEGLHAIFSKQALEEKMKSLEFIEFPKEKAEREKIIFRSYDSMNVNVA